MISYRKCLGSKDCPRSAEFRLYTEPIVFEVGNQATGVSVETYLCAHHMRFQMRKMHEEGGTMLIDRA